jgi:hypothetical protein
VSKPSQTQATAKNTIASASKAVRLTLKRFIPIRISLNPRNNSTSRPRDDVDQTRRAQGIVRRNMAINPLLTLPSRYEALVIARQGLGKLIETLR